MNRMLKIFEEMKNRNEKVTVLYFPIGDPIIGDSVEYAEKYFEAGCTVLEIGLPYEDPYMDGSTVADSMERARNNGVSLVESFDIIKKIRERCPNNILQPFTYMENVMKIGIPEFAKKCAECDADAVLIPVTTVEQREELDMELGKYGIINLRFKPYNMSNEDIEDSKKNAKGYIFSQAVNGATGARETVDPHVKENIVALKENKVNALVVPGFGISDANQAKQVLDMGADGFVVGSATIKHIQNGDGIEFIKSLHAVCRTEDNK